MRRAAAWLVWYGGLVGLWLLYVGNVSAVERVAGLCAAAVAAAAVEVVRAQGLLGYRVEARWVARGLRQALRVIPDFGTVMLVLAHSLVGRGAAAPSAPSTPARVSA